MKSDTLLRIYLAVKTKKRIVKFNYPPVRKSYNINTYG